jgi:hypothetical protein
LRRKNENDEIIFGFLGKVEKLEEFDIGGDLKGLIVKIKSVNLKSFALRWRGKTGSIMDKSSL